jgi:hypothetical protein
MLKARFRTLFFAVLALPTFAAGCSDSSTSSEDVAGTYVLVSFAGEALPIVYYDDATLRAELRSGSIVLDSDEEFRLTLAERITDKTRSPATVYSEDTLLEGTYSVNGSRVTIRYEDEDGDTQSGALTIDDNELVIGDEGEELVFRKQ